MTTYVISTLGTDENADSGWNQGHLIAEIHDALDNPKLLIDGSQEKFGGDCEKITRQEFEKIKQQILASKQKAEIDTLIFRGFSRGAAGINIRIATLINNDPELNHIKCHFYGIDPVAGLTIKNKTEHKELPTNIEDCLIEESEDEGRRYLRSQSISTGRVYFKSYQDAIEKARSELLTTESLSLAEQKPESKKGPTFNETYQSLKKTRIKVIPIRGAHEDAVYTHDGPKALTSVVSTHLLREFDFIRSHGGKFRDNQIPARRNKKGTVVEPAHLSENIYKETLKAYKKLYEEEYAYLELAKKKGQGIYNFFKWGGYATRSFANIVDRYRLNSFFFDDYHYYAFIQVFPLISQYCLSNNSIKDYIKEIPESKRQQLYNELLELKEKLYFPKKHSLYKRMLLLEIALKEKLQTNKSLENIKSAENLQSTKKTDVDKTAASITEVTTTSNLLDSKQITTNKMEQQPSIPSKPESSIETEPTIAEKHNPFFNRELTDFEIFLNVIKQHLSIMQRELTNYCGFWQYVGTSYDEADHLLNFISNVEKLSCTLEEKEEKIDRELSRVFEAETKRSSFFRKNLFHTLDDIITFRFKQAKLLDENSNNNCIEKFKNRYKNLNQFASISIVIADKKKTAPKL